MFGVLSSKKIDDYQLFWRKNYESISAVSWGCAAVTAYLWLQMVNNLPSAPFLATFTVCAAMAIYRANQAIKLHVIKSSLRGKELTFLKIKQNLKLLKDESALPWKKKQTTERIWMGWGFTWGQRHTQLSYDIIKRDSSMVLPAPKKGHEKGSKWIHGLEVSEDNLYFPLNYANGHTLIVGSTGSGKTRLFDLLITQLLIRNPNDSVIIIDPKGDKDLQTLAKKACALSGKEDRYIKFHPGFPEESSRINLIKNFNRPTEVASRIAGLIVSESGSDPFKAFGQMAVNHIVQGMLICNERPMLTSIRRYLEGGPAPLVIKAIKAYCEKTLPENSGWHNKMQDYLANAGNSEEEKAAYLLMFYRKEVQPGYPSSDLEGLLSMFEHDRAHFSKMIASLLPILGMLTSNAMAGLLSPDGTDENDQRPVRDTQSIINNGQCAYIGLDSLTDSMVGSAIGTLFLADLASVAGDRYNYGVCEDNYVNIFVDECSEVICDQLISMLARARGSKFRLFVATQTIQDFAARMGSEAKAYQVLGNVNNTISLRITEDKTQEYIANKLPETRVKYVMTSQGTNTGSDSPQIFSGNQSERLMEEKIQMFIPQLLGQLPDLEYVAMLTDGKLVKGRVPILINEIDKQENNKE